MPSGRVEGRDRGAHLAAECLRARPPFRSGARVLGLTLHRPRVAAAAEITRAAPGVAVLMLTMFDDDDSVFAAMRAGARGYVLKGAQQDEIVRAIHAVAAGEAIFGPGIARRVLGLVSAPATAHSTPFPGLTSREPEVLELIAAGVRNTDRPADVDRAEDGRQPRRRDLQQAAGRRPEPGHHRGSGRRPGPKRFTVSSTPVRGSERRPRGYPARLGERAGTDCPRPGWRRRHRCRAD
jgi:FixJ family two-component response regulator